MDISRGPRRPSEAPAATADAERLDQTGSLALATKVEILSAICRRHESTVDALLETIVKLHGANSALRAENASLRTRTAVSMVERVRAMPRGRPPLLNAGGTSR